MLRKALTIALIVAATAEARKDRDKKDKRKDERDGRNSMAVREGFKRDKMRKKRNRGREFIAEEGENETEKFLQWSQYHERNYHDGDEFSKRQKNWKDNNKRIREFNKKADTSGDPNAVHLAHTNNSDLSVDEIQKKFGLVETEEGRRRMEAADAEGGRRELFISGNAVDWSADTAPIQDQGYCGSCWAFAANTVLETTIKLLDDSKGWEKLSAQMPVDCTLDNDDNVSTMGAQVWQYYLGGCDGGHQERLFDFYQNHGVMLEDDYPYVSGYNGGTETQCQYDSSKATFPVAGRGSADTPQEILDALQTRPLTIGVAASPENFGFYSSGIVSSGSEFCGTQTNHAMVIVGFEPGLGGTQEVTTEEFWCRYRQWYDDYYRTGCRWSDETYYAGYCCWYETVTETVPAADQSSWKVQNQYGEGWGDEGFIHYAVEDGAGACNINTDVDYVIIKNE